MVFRSRKREADTEREADRERERREEGGTGVGRRGKWRGDTRRSEHTARGAGAIATAQGGLQLPSLLRSILLSGGASGPTDGRQLARFVLAGEHEADGVGLRGKAAF